VQHKKENAKIKEQIELYQRLMNSKQEEDGVDEALDMDNNNDVDDQ
jgi:hypothetical protein